MKPIRNYSDGQWLLLLWAFIVIFLVAGLAFSTPVLVIAILAAIAAGYTTYLYLRELVGRSPNSWPFGRIGGATAAGPGGTAGPGATAESGATAQPDAEAPGNPNVQFGSHPDTGPRDTENHEGGAQ